jgi:hypothetical protein
MIGLLDPKTVGLKGMFQLVVVLVLESKSSFLCGDFGFKSTMNAFNWLFLVVLQLNILAIGALVILCF